MDPAPTGGSGSAAEGPIAELIEAYEPLPPTVTSDHTDAQLRRQRELLQRLRGGSRDLGLEALEAYRRGGELPEPTRVALLKVAAAAAPDSTSPLLEELIVTWSGGSNLGLRTQAVRILAESDPQRALALLEPLVLETRHKRTLPPQEALVNGWVAAAERTGTGDPRVLADVLVDIGQPADARYAAAGALGRIGGEVGVRALEEVLVESSSDGLLRRKAAQALREALPPERLCPLLLGVADRETDHGFLIFLADMVEKNCP